MKTWAAMLLALAAAAVLPSSALAQPDHFVQRAERRAELHLRGSNGYRISVSASQTDGRRRSRMYVSARKGPASVTYTLPSRIGPENSIDVRLPGVGRISVHFEPRKVETGIPIENCRGRTDMIERGYYRGAIRLHGEKGYTEVDRKSARGTVTRTFRQECDAEATGKRRFPFGRLRYAALVAGRSLGRRSLRFIATTARIGRRDLGVSFAASVQEKRGKMLVASSVDMSTGGRFYASPPSEPRLAEVEPPRPFEGSGIFRLTSPKASIWEGDLAVEMPGVGPVLLSGDEFWSTLCQRGGCSKTLPHGVSFGFVFIG